MAYQLLLSVCVIVILMVNTDPVSCATGHNSDRVAVAVASDYDRVCRLGSLNSTLGCDPRKNLHCHPLRQTCRCIKPPPSVNTTHNYEWDNYAGACVLVPRHYYHKCALLYYRNNGTHPASSSSSSLGSGQQPICKLDSQCQASALGQHSRCNLESCTCECLSNVHVDVNLNHGGSGSGAASSSERAVWKKGGFCHVQRRLGEVCNSTQECASIDIEGGGPPALCDGSTGVCECDPATHVQVGKKCARNVMRLETEPCDHDVQCKALDPQASCVNVNASANDTKSGPGSISGVVRVCKCGNGTAAYKGRCYNPRGYNETCGQDEECRLELGPGAKCADMELILELGNNSTESEENEETGVCGCDDEDGGAFEFDNIAGTCVPTSAEGDDTDVFVEATEALTQNGTSAPNGTSFAFLFPKLPAPIPEDGASTIDWVKRTVIISAAVILTILATGLLVAYSNWKRVKLVRQMEHELKESNSKQPLLKGLSETGFEVGEDEYEVDREAVLGSGRNGIVYRGYFKPRALHVAVKTNRELISSELYLRAILEEAKVLIHLGPHPNVVQFYGVCQATINEGNVYLFCELCPLGSLETFLRTNRSMFELSPHEIGSSTQFNSNREETPPRPRPGSDDRSDYRMSMLLGDSHSRASTASDTPSKLSQSHLYRWAYQLASAMEFVSARKVIHSDLAARNVLLSTLACVKLTDFGLSRRLYDNYTYMKMGKDPLPWKWLDYDALRLNLFTTNTDVWSYGITLWEIWTLGEVPYPGIVTPYCQDFISRLLDGLHPTQPGYASGELYELMVKCWNPNPTERPSFSTLKEELEVQMKKLGYTKGAGGEELDGFGYLMPLTYSK